MMHIFKAWHPSKGGLPAYEELEFHFDRAVSRQDARDIVERVEGYVIFKEQRPRKGPYIHNPRPKVQGRNAHRAK